MKNWSSENTFNKEKDVKFYIYYVPSFHYVVLVLENRRFGTQYRADTVQYGISGTAEERYGRHTVPYNTVRYSIYSNTVEPGI